MNLKKTPISLIMMGLFVMAVFAVTSCDNNNEPSDDNNAELIIGTWVNTMVNNQDVLTDATFVLEFKLDNTESHNIGIEIDENNKSWQENSANTYSVSGDMISIDGSDNLGNAIHMECKIQ